MFDYTSLHFLYISTLEIFVHNNTILYCNCLINGHDFENFCKIIQNKNSNEKVKKTLEKLCFLTHSNCRINPKV